MDYLSKNQLKRLAGYRNSKVCEEEKVFVVEGEKMCGEALRSGFGIRCTCGTEEWMSRNARALTDCAECHTVSSEQLERLSLMRTPNKVWMLVERQQPQVEDGGLILALDGLQDPGNMGTILRTADWYGVRHVVCSHETVSCHNAKVVQSTMGAIFRTRVDYCDLPDWLSQRHNEGIPIYGAILDGTPLSQIEIEKPSVLVIGNEGHGISEWVASLLSHSITIPNRGGTCESLNAAVATAVIMNEFFR